MVVTSRSSSSLHATGKSNEGKAARNLTDHPQILGVRAIEAHTAYGAIQVQGSPPAAVLIQFLLPEHSHPHFDRFAKGKI